MSLPLSIVAQFARVRHRILAWCCVCRCGAAGPLIALLEPPRGIRVARSEAKRAASAPPAPCTRDEHEDNPGDVHGDGPGGGGDGRLLLSALRVLRALLLQPAAREVHAMLS